MRWLIPLFLLSMSAQAAAAGPTAEAREVSAARMLAELKGAEARPQPGIMTDRPIYLPGSTIWFRTWNTDAAVELLDGRGQSVAPGHRDRMFAEAGYLDVPSDAGAGHYRLRVGAVERPIIIERSRRPPLQFELRFARASHRVGDRVAAAVAVRRADGEPLADQAVAATVTVEGAPPLELTGRTDREGRLGLGFELPAGEGGARLNLRVDVDGAVNGFTRPIPLTPAAPTVDILPEGGFAIAGLPGRVYLAARRAGGRPADIVGQVIEDGQTVIAEVRSVIDGRARFDWTPRAGRTYRLVLSDGASIPLPKALPTGCTLRAVDDFADARASVGVGVGVDLRCTEDRPLIVIASRDEAVLSVDEVRAGPATATRVELNTPRRRGPVTITVLATDGLPLAERVVSGAGAQPWLTAYAVVQLHDTGVDRAIITRAAGWLAGRRARAPRSFDDRRPAVSAWIDWALAVGGQPAAVSPLTPDAAADPYVLAVRILTLVAADRRDEAAPLAEALQAMAEPDGRWTGARSSITGSRGAGLVVETTALAVRALAALDRAPTLRSRALDALDAARRGGAWHTTQATVQALAATLSHVRAYGGSTPGEVRVRVDGRVVWRERVDTRRMTAYVVPLTAHLADAATVEVSQTGGGWIGWSAVGRWTAELPASAASARLTLATALDRPTLAMGRAGTLTATVSAAPGDAPVSDPLLRIGLPAGLEIDRGQLRDWTEQGRVALAEVRPGEVVLYLDRLDAGETARFPLTVTARRRGRFQAAASSAYPYYSPDPAWAPGLAVEIR